MGFFKYIFFSQYFELREKGTEHKAYLNGNVLIATLLVFIAGALFMVQLSFFPDFELFTDWMGDTFDTGSNRLSGKLLGLVALVIMIVVVRFTIGNKKKYKKNIETFSKLPYEQQKKYAKRGNNLFILILFSSLFVLMMSFFLADW
jgi:hypothetical protein